MYKILTITDRYFVETMDALQEWVNEHIAAGWKPVGGVGVVTKAREGDWYQAFQAMTKDDCNE